ELVIVDRMRDRRWLHFIVHRTDAVEILDACHRQRRGFPVDRNAAAHRVDLLSRIGDDDRRAGRLARRLLMLRSARREAHGDDQRQQRRDPFHAITTLTAHFLKSVCFDIGQVASSVVLLMSCAASNHGTKTSPMGTRLRPRVSTRLRISPRREMTFTSSPRFSPRALASSGFMNTTAEGKALYS